MHKQKIGNKLSALVGDKAGNNSVRKYDLNDNRKRIFSKTRHNSNIIKQELKILVGISNTAFDDNIKYL